MKKVYSILVAALFCSISLFAQEDVTVYKVEVPPTMDGVADDDIWGNENKAPIQQMLKNFGTELNNNTCYWQAVHDGEFIYVLVSVQDQVNFLEDPTGMDPDNWHFDRVELFFDMRSDSDDGFGPGDLGPGEEGNGTFRYKARAMVNQGSNATYASLQFTDANYIIEWKIPFSELEEGAGDIVLADGVQKIGFEVIVIDRDVISIPFGRKVWAIDGPIEDAWDNMDDAGHLILLQESTVSISSNVATKSFQVYPNPVQNKLNVEFKSLIGVAIYNITGQEVLNVNATNDKMEIDISQLKKGIYFIKATDSKGVVETHKIIKQ